MQCRHGRELQLLTRRSMIMCMVHEARNEFSSKSKVMEYFLHPHCVKHPLVSISKCRDQLFSFPQIERCIVNRDQYIANDIDNEIDIQKLLLFEPYFELNPNIIKKLSNEAMFHEYVNDTLLSMIASDIGHKYHPIFKSLSHSLGMRVTEATDEMLQILKQILKKRKPNGATRQDLYDFLNQMSIFYGRQCPHGMEILYSYSTS